MTRFDYPVWLTVAFLAGLVAPLCGGLSFLCPLCVLAGVFLVASHRRRLERWHKPSKYLNCASVIVQQDEESFWLAMRAEGPFDEF